MYIIYGTVYTKNTKLTNKTSILNFLKITNKTMNSNLQTPARKGQTQEKCLKRNRRRIELSNKYPMTKITLEYFILSAISL